MKIWKLSSDVNDYDSLMEKNPDNKIDIQLVDGRSMIEGWKPIELKRMYSEGEMPLSDYPYYYGVPVLSKKAIDVLMPLIQDSIELLEVQFDEKEYRIANITKVLDVIDYEKSIFKKFSNSEKIMLFKKYSFRICDELVNNDIFKLIDEPPRRPFVSDRFKECVEKNSLTGFKFELVWDSEEDKEQ